MKDAIEYLIPYSVVDSSLIGSPEENSKTSRFSIKVGASGTLKGYWLLPDVYKGKQFVNGIIIKNNIQLERKAA